MSAKPIQPGPPTPFTRGVLVAVGIVLAVVALTLLILHNNRNMAMPAAAALLAGYIVAGWLRLDDVAAYVFIVVVKPFRVGDRLTLPGSGVEGEIAEIGHMRTKLLPIDRAGVADADGGRLMRVPNSVLLHQAICRTDTRRRDARVSAEVSVQVAYDSDWDTVETALLNAARAVAGDLTKSAGREVVVEAESAPLALVMRVRYVVPDAERLKSGTEILKRALAEMQASGKVRFGGLGSAEGSKRAAGPAEPSAEKPVDVDLGKIDDTGDSVDFRPADPHYIQELADRIRQMGLLQPIVVQQTESGRYSLVAGRFRFLACKQLGWQRIPALVREAEAKKSTT